MVVEPTGSETQVVRAPGRQESSRVFRERHEFAPGEKIRLRPRGSRRICSTRRAANGSEVA